MRPAPVRTPAALRSAIEAELRQVPAPLGKQISALSRLFQMFTSSRGALGRISYLDDPKLRAAYLRYHLPLNAARAAWVLEDLQRAYPRISELEDVVDLGAGPGSASAATHFGLGGAGQRRFRLHDRSRAALKLARKILTACGAAVLSAEVSPLPALPRMPPRALVWLSMVLNELGVGAPRGPDPAALLERLAARLETGSVVIVMEPALRAPGIALLRLHDAATGSGAWRVLGPCTHQLGCPLLRERDRSWCHFRFAWDAPAFVRDVADPLGLEHAEPSVAYVALERAVAPASKDTGEPCARVIGDPMAVEGGRRGIYICAEGERKLVSPAPQAWRRGDVVAGQ